MHSKPAECEAAWDLHVNVPSGQGLTGHVTLAFFPFHDRTQLRPPSRTSRLAQREREKERVREREREKLSDMACSAVAFVYLGSSGISFHSRDMVISLDRQWSAVLEHGT